MRFLSILFLLILTGKLYAQQEQSYHNNRLGFTITIPEGWQVSARDSFDQYKITTVASAATTPDAPPSNRPKINPAVVAGSADNSQSTPPPMISLTKVEARPERKPSSVNIYKDRTQLSFTTTMQTGSGMLPEPIIAQIMEQQINSYKTLLEAYDKSLTTGEMEKITIGGKELYKQHIVVKEDGKTISQGAYYIWMGNTYYSLSIRTSYTGEAEKKTLDKMIAEAMQSF